MEEPPTKRAKRMDSTAVRDRNEDSNRDTASPRSPRPHGKTRDNKPHAQNDRNNTGHISKRDDAKRRKSRSPHDRHEHSKRAQSPLPKDQAYKERTKGRDRAHQEDNRRDREKDRDRERSRSRSRDRHRSTRDHRPDRTRGRSRSPFRNGESATSTRRRTPPRPRPKVEDQDIKSVKDIKPTTNGSSTEKMEVDDVKDDVDMMMKRMMGFASFKSTQNTKVPGNQIYGVRKEKKTEYRQYMNRVGGFNRPLSPG